MGGLGGGEEGRASFVVVGLRKGQPLPVVGWRRSWRIREVRERWYAPIIVKRVGRYFGFFCEHPRDKEALLENHVSASQLDNSETNRKRRQLQMADTSSKRQKKAEWDSSDEESFSEQQDDQDDMNVDTHLATKVLNQPILVSDHAAIIVDTNSVSFQKNRPYQSENWCLNFPEIGEIICQVWKIDFPGSPSFVLSSRMSVARNRLRHCLGLDRSSVPRHIIISDAAWKNDENRGGLGRSLLKTTLNDNVGKGGYDFGSASSAVHAEALACLKSLKWALMVHLTSVEVYTDSFNMVDRNMVASAHNKAQLAIGWALSFEDIIVI
uniref:RNase H type-1 domain-containing protein n=1 Tax=Chenopodium quinoa TaxID=63459 RepID=A0A803MAL8_CHEQI